MSTITVDFSEKTGVIKPLHGVNNGPKNNMFNIDTTKYFVEAGIPYSRLHDTEYPYGKGHFVDIPCIFPDFDADAQDPNSYDFTLTDLYIEAIYQAGTEVFYRLGVSIEHGPKKYHIFPPKDPLKWAQICEGIIRHYTEGWANGYHYNMKYWEIWCEPDNPPLWQGTTEEFCELYRVSANYLKERFQDLKIGGYASCGFYAMTRENPSDYLKSFMTFFDEFFDYITAKETYAPIDFFSWHLYSSNVKELRKHAEFVEEALKKYGLENTESVLSEWNFDHGQYDILPTNVGAAMCMAQMCVLQKSTVTVAMYYEASPMSRWCGLFDRSYLIGKAKKPINAAKPFYAFKAFNELYKLKNEVSNISESENIYTCAAANEKEGAVVLCNYSDSDECAEIDVKNFVSDKGVRAEHYVLDEKNDLTLVRKEYFKGISFQPIVYLEKNSFVLIKFYKE